MSSERHEQSKNRLQIEYHDLNEQWQLVQEVITRLRKVYTLEINELAKMRLEEDIKNAQQTKQEIEEKLRHQESRLARLSPNDDQKLSLPNIGTKILEFDEWQEIYRASCELLHHLAVPYQSLLIYRYRPQIIDLYNVADIFGECLFKIKMLSDTIKSCQHAQSFLFPGFHGEIYESGAAIRKKLKNSAGKEDFDGVYSQFTQLKEIISEVLAIADRRMAILAEYPRQDIGA